MSKTLTICVCASRPYMSTSHLTQLAASAEVAGWSVSLIADMCELAEHHSPHMQRIAASDVVAGCHGRAMKSLLSYCGATPASLLDIRQDTPAEWLAQLGIDTASLPADQTSAAMEKFRAEILAMPVKDGKDAWYPVLDKDACVECGKCHDFCPFGVYAMEDGKVSVEHPSNCKNNCPACARNCPTSAIIFPKYRLSPINGGAGQEDNAVQLDTRDLYATALRERLEARRKAGRQFLKQ